MGELIITLRQQIVHKGYYINKNLTQVEWKCCTVIRLAKVKSPCEGDAMLTKKEEQCYIGVLKETSVT